MRQVLGRAVVSLSVFGAMVLPGFDAPAAAQTTVFRQLLGAGRFGAQVREITESDVKSNKLPGLHGAYVVDVTEGGAAEKAGIKAGDVVVSFDGETVRSTGMLARLVEETPADRAVKVGVVRDGKRLDVDVTLSSSRDRAFSLMVPRSRGEEFRWDTPQFRVEPRPLPRTPDLPLGPQLAPPLWRFDTPSRLGIGVQDLTPQLREYFGVQQGVLVSSVRADSPGARAGVKAGDIITAVNGQAVRTAADVRRELQAQDAGETAALSINRDGKQLTLKVSVERSARTTPIRGR